MSIQGLDLNEIRWDNIGTEPTEQRKTDGRAPQDRLPAGEHNWYRNKMETFVTAVVNAIRNSFSADISAYYGNTKLGDDMQDDSVWTSLSGAQSADSVNIKIGDYALKILENDALAGSLQSKKDGITLDFSKLNNGKVSIDSDYIYFVFYVSDVASINTGGGGIQFAFSQDAVYSDDNIKYNNITTGLVTGWNFVKMLKSTFFTAGTGTWSGIQSMRILWASNAGYQNEYISFQLIQLVKKDPVFNIPNPFQRFEVNDFEINSAEWFVGKEFGKIIARELSDATGDISSLQNSFNYSDFIINSIKQVHGSSIVDAYVTWYVDADNAIVCLINADALILRKIEAGITDDTNTIPLVISEGDILEYSLKKDGMKLELIVYLNRDYSNPYEIDTTTTISTASTGNLCIGSSSVNNAMFHSASITEIAHAHHSDIAEMAKDVINTWLDYIPTLTFTGTPPGSIITVSRYRQIGNKVDFNISLSSADGNGATDLRVSLPVTPKDNNSVINVSSQEKVDTTWSNPLAYIDDDAGLGIQFRNFSTATDTVAWEMIITGSYEV